MPQIIESNVEQWGWYLKLGGNHWIRIELCLHFVHFKFTFALNILSGVQETFTMSDQEIEE